MKTLHTIYKIMVNTLLLVIILLTLLLVGIRFLGFTPYSVLSGSMEPTYPVGALIYVKETAPEDIKVGDPITFVLNEDLVVATHRVIEIDAENQQFRTQGDANTSPDAAPVHFKNLIGKPIFHVPLLGYVAGFLATEKGMIVGGCAIICVLILLFFPDILRWIDRKEHQQDTNTVSSSEGEET